MTPGFGHPTDAGSDACATYFSASSIFSKISWLPTTPYERLASIGILVFPRDSNYVVAYSQAFLGRGEQSRSSQMKVEENPRSSRLGFSPSDADYEGHLRIDCRNLGAAD
jgi:hypothetical protein